MDKEEIEKWDKKNSKFGRNLMIGGFIILCASILGMNFTNDPIPDLFIFLLTGFYGIMFIFIPCIMRGFYINRIQTKIIIDLLRKK